MYTHRDEIELSNKLCTKWCGEYIPLIRFNNGFKTCYSCGEKEAKHLSSLFTVACNNKQGYELIYNPKDLCTTNPKRTM